MCCSDIWETSKCLESVWVDVPGSFGTQLIVSWLHADRPNFGKSETDPWSWKHSMYFSWLVLSSISDDYHRNISSLCEQNGMAVFKIKLNNVCSFISHVLLHGISPKYLLNITERKKYNKL